MINFCHGARLFEKDEIGSMHLTKLNIIGASKATTTNPPRISKTPANIHLMSIEMHVRTPRRIAARPSTTVPILIDHCTNIG